ncbi:MAG: hypothetical protein AB1755_02225 [Candidatus Omnitrophota bacterium]
MNYLNLREKFKDFTIFSLSDVRKVYPTFDRRRLTEWQSKGYIQKIIRGYYIFSDFKIEENSLFTIANKIYNPSYISFETALSYYHLIPEAVYTVTSVSTKKTHRFKTGIAEFNYRTLTPALFFGYNIVSYNGKTFKIATPEKAVIDYFYLNSNLEKDADYASLRINKDEFLDIIDEKKMVFFLNKFKKKNLKKRIKTFMEFIKNA